MKNDENKNQWERTSVTNLLRNRVSGTYYARVRVNGKQKWRTLETTKFTVAKLRLRDIEKELREQGELEVANKHIAKPADMSVRHFADLWQTQTNQNPLLAANTKLRREIALKAVFKTWPALATRMITTISSRECQQWAVTALREGTGFVAPNAKTKRKGMSASAFNKAVDALRAIFDIGKQMGVIYRNPALEIEKASVRAKSLSLPSTREFNSVVGKILRSPSRWSEDCADLVRFLAYSGLRLREATALRWKHIKEDSIKVPGTKTEASVRTLPLFPSLKRLIAEIRLRQGSTNPDQPLLQIGGALGALASACKAVGVGPLTHHDLRHLFATRCIESGVDIPTVSRWLGHADGGALAMKVYGHLRHEHSAAQAAKVDFGEAAG